MTAALFSSFGLASIRSLIGIILAFNSNYATIIVTIQKKNYSTVIILQYKIKLNVQNTHFIVRLENQLGSFCKHNAETTEHGLFDKVA